MAKAGSKGKAQRPHRFVPKKAGHKTHNKYVSRYCVYCGHPAAAATHPRCAKRAAKKYSQ